MKPTKNLIFCAILLLASCESFVTGISEDDITKGTDADLKLIVVAAEINYMGFLEGQAARLAGMWSGYFRGTDRQYFGLYNYNVTTSTFDREWQNVYVHTLKQLRIAEQKATSQNNLSTKGMCQVMEASIIGTATALWGNVPYSEAVDAEKYPNPAYDAQEPLIAGLILLLDDAIMNLTDNVGDREGDFLSTGDNTQWLKVAHSVKARLMLYKKDYVKALLEANLGIQELGDDLMAMHGKTFATDLNLYFDFLIISWPGSMTAENTHLGMLLDPQSPATRNHAKTNEDARLMNYYIGNSIDDLLPNTNEGGFFFADAGFPLHGAFETKLIAAECLVRLGDLPTAIIKLNEHRANLRQAYPSGNYLDFVSNDFDPGEIENISGTKTNADALLYEILEEKWVCLYGQIEAFNDIRRAKNILNVPINAGTDFPQRFLYSQNEIIGNSNTPNPVPDLNEPTTLFKQ